MSNDMVILIELLMNLTKYLKYMASDCGIHISGQKPSILKVEGLL